jgi:hypothetical protein
LDKANLHEGHAYVFRENTRAWERAEDRPLRVTLVRQLGGGQHLVRFDDGSEAEVRSAQLIEEWTPERIERLLQAGERERVFRANTITDRTASEAVALVFGTVVDDFDAHHDRVWISREQEGTILTAAEFAEDPLDLSPVAFRDDDGELWLPLPAAVLLAKRIAERNPESVVSAVDAHHQELLSGGYASLVELYKPGWDTALGWAGKEAKVLPRKEMAPSDAFQELWDRLRGQGVRRRGTEEHAWWVEPDQLMGLGHLLAHVARHVGRVTIRPLADGKVRLALDYVREPRALEPGEARNLALSLSRQQARMLAEVRDAGPDGAELPANHGSRTMESLLGYGLVWESEVADEGPASEFRRGRFRLTDAGWRVLEYLGPRSIE